MLSSRKNLLEFTQADILKEWERNFIPIFNAMKHEIKVMQKQQFGKIINIASVLGHIGIRHAIAYGAAKASIINMTKVAAIEQAENNIKINSISPATIDTPMLREKYSGTLPNYSEVYYTKTCGTPSDVFHVVRMFEMNEFITGSDVKIDGGMTELFNL